MKVVIVGHETCGLIGVLADEFRRRGESVVTVAKSSSMFPYTYDFDLYDFPLDYLSRNFGGRIVWRRALQVLWALNPSWHRALEASLRNRVAKGAKLYIQVWGGVPVEEDVLASLSKSGTSSAILFMGSDVRDYNIFMRQYGVTEELIPQRYREVPLVEKLRLLRLHERYTDAIFSVPDQMGLALRPYHHLQVPADINRFRFNIPAREIPRVVHALGAGQIKGTSVIENALLGLRQEGIEFELEIIRDMPHEAVLNTLAEADVLVDELVGHGPGWLSFEAMASGCAVATRYLTDSPGCFRPPVVPIDEHNIAERLRRLLTDRKLRVELAEAGRRYVEENNGVERVVDSIIDKTLRGRSGPHDYVPSYLRNTYIPRDSGEAAAINAESKFVAGEEWYIAGVAGSSHDGLVF